MRKNKFLALTMLCSVLSGVSANAQEVKNSGSQTTGEVKNSSGNKGTPNSDKNVEKITKKAPNSKKAEGVGSSGIKKPDAKKDDKEITKDKTKGSGEVSSKSFEWEDFKKRFGNGVSSFVDLVKRHPIWSSIIGVGSVTTEEVVRRKYFKNKKPVGQAGGVWGVDKFGYNEAEDCIYRSPKGKINVIILGSEENRKKFINGFKNNKNKSKTWAEKFMNMCNKHTKLDLTEERAKFDNWDIIEEDCDVNQEPNKNFIDKLNTELKDDVAALIIIGNGEEGLKKFTSSVKTKIKKVKNIDIKGSKQSGEFSVCMKFSTKV